jgi:hypothetical protein
MAIILMHNTPIIHIGISVVLTGEAMRIITQQIPCKELRAFN